jgi:Methyltransferase domain
MSIRFKTTSAVCLQDEIRKLGPAVNGLELGVWYGYNMGHILEECDNVKMLWGVDPYLPYQDWNRYIGQDLMDAAEQSTRDILSVFPNRSELLKTTSEEASKKFPEDELDFIFIDGDHSYERCYEDLNLWYSKVRPGGLFSGHDFSLPGVNKALLDFRTENNIKGFFKVIPNDVWFWIKD